MTQTKNLEKVRNVMSLLPTIKLTICLPVLPHCVHASLPLHLAASMTHSARNNLILLPHHIPIEYVLLKRWWWYWCMLCYVCMYMESDPKPKESWHCPSTATRAHPRRDARP